MTSQYETQPKVQLRNFWQSHKSDFHPNFHGDVAKSFLVELIGGNQHDDFSQIFVSSVYPNQYKDRLNWSKFRKVFESDDAKLEALRRQYGHDSKISPVPGSTNIWFTGENVRPPLHQKWDKFLSYDLDDFGGRNIYLPLWALRLSHTIESADATQSSLATTRTAIATRGKRICAVISNPEPFRMNFVEKLSKYVAVDVFGKTGLPLHNKYETLQQYQFNICFENDLYPGYVTEKPFEAYISGCIPIWRGLDDGGHLNQDALINVSGKRTSSAIEEILDNLTDEYVFRTTSQPLIMKKINLKEISAEIGSVLKQD